MEYRVMAKAKRDHRFHCYGYHSDAKVADRHAQNLADSLWTTEVKVICIDGNLKEELIYKERS